MAVQTVPTIPPSFILNVKVFIREHDVEKFLTAFKPAYDAVLAEEGCVWFVAGQTSTDSGEQGSEAVRELWWTEGWKVPEEWKDRAVQWFMDVQFKKPYYAPYLQATEPLFVKDRIFDIVTPQDGMGHFKMET